MMRLHLPEFSILNSSLANSTYQGDHRDPRATFSSGIGWRILTREKLNRARGVRAA
jgi:hypothetical protein